MEKTEEKSEIVSEIEPIEDITSMREAVLFTFEELVLRWKLSYTSNSVQYSLKKAKSYTN